MDGCVWECIEWCGRALSGSVLCRRVLCGRVLCGRELSCSIIQYKLYPLWLILGQMHTH